MVTISKCKIFAGTILISALLVGTSLPGKSQEIPDLEQGMEYSEARQLLLEAGWQAFYIPIFLGINHRDNPLSGTAESLVQDYEHGELVNCAGTGLGLCRFEFSNINNQTLVIVTSNNDLNPDLYRWWLEEDE